TGWNVSPDSPSPVPGGKTPSAQQNWLVGLNAAALPRAPLRSDAGKCQPRRWHPHNARLFAHMLQSQKGIDATNEQIGDEFSASLQYYAIGAHFAAEALPQLS